MSNQSADAVFDALGEPVRQRILELLHEGPTPVGRLAERLPVGRPAVSKHLRVLSNAGPIEHHSVGTRNLYVLAPDGMAAAQQWLVRTWDTVLAAYPQPRHPGRGAGQRPRPPQGQREPVAAPVHYRGPHRPVLHQGRRYVG